LYRTYRAQLWTNCGSLQKKSQPVVADSSIRDLRSLLWSSIDDRKSRDLDQVEYAEELAGGDVRVLVELRTWMES